MDTKGFTPAEMRKRSERLSNCACGGDWDQHPHTLCYDCETAAMLRQAAETQEQRDELQTEIDSIRATLRHTAESATEHCNYALVLESALAEERQKVQSWRNGIALAIQAKPNSDNASDEVYYKSGLELALNLADSLALPGSPETPKEQA